MEMRVPTGEYARPASIGYSATEGSPARDRRECRRQCSAAEWKQVRKWKSNHRSQQGPCLSPQDCTGPDTHLHPPDRAWPDSKLARPLHPLGEPRSKLRGILSGSEKATARHTRHCSSVVRLPRWRDSAGRVRDEPGCRSGERAQNRGTSTRCRGTSHRHRADRHPGTRGPDQPQSHTHIHSRTRFAGPGRLCHHSGCD